VAVAVQSPGMIGFARAPRVTDIRKGGDGDLKAKSRKRTRDDMVRVSGARHFLPRYGLELKPLACVPQSAPPPPRPTIPRPRPAQSFAGPGPSQHAGSFVKPRHSGGGAPAYDRAVFVESLSGHVPKSLKAAAGDEAEGSGEDDGMGVYGYKHLAPERQRKNRPGQRARQQLLERQQGQGR
jgi:hypothetical protein